ARSTAFCGVAGGALTGDDDVAAVAGRAPGSRCFPGPAAPGLASGATGAVARKRAAGPSACSPAGMRRQLYPGFGLGASGGGFFGLFASGVPGLVRVGLVSFAPGAHTVARASPDARRLCDSA